MEAGLQTVQITPADDRIRCLHYVHADGTVSDETLRRRAAGSMNAAFAASWKRSTCEATAYPAFTDEKEITLPDQLEEEQPTFSGFVRYENCFEAAAGDSMVLEISDAHEGVEVFLNGKSLGLQVVPVYRYDLTGHLQDGVNDLCIEAATTLERARSVDPDPYGRKPAPTARSGITGEVRMVKL